MKKLKKFLKDNVNNFLLGAILVIAAGLTALFVNSQNEFFRGVEENINVASRQSSQPDESLVKATTLIAFGDSGSGSDDQKTIAKLIDREEFDAVVHTGDLAYDNGTKDELKERFLDVYSNKIKTKFYPSIGNHDNRTDSAGPYLDLFALPTDQLNEEDKERYYSADIGNVHLVSLDTNDSLERISQANKTDMADWLRRDLRRVADNKVIIVFFHHPPFNAGLHDPEIKVRQKLVPIFDKFGVDLVLSGHDHNYQRTCPMLYSQTKFTCRSDGVPYIITGGGGKSLYDLDANLPEYIEFTKLSSHFLKIDVLPWSITMSVISDNGDLIETVIFNTR